MIERITIKVSGFQLKEGTPVDSVIDQWLEKGYALERIFNNGCLVPGVVYLTFSKYHHPLPF